jgi:hypothetical protein
MILIHNGQHCGLPWSRVSYQVAKIVLPLPNVPLRWIPVGVEFIERVSTFEFSSLLNFSWFIQSADIGVLELETTRKSGGSWNSGFSSEKRQTRPFDIQRTNPPNTVLGRISDIEDMRNMRFLLPRKHLRFKVAVWLMYYLENSMLALGRPYIIPQDTSQSKICRQNWFYSHHQKASSFLPLCFLLAQLIMGDHGRSLTGNRR